MLRKGIGRQEFLLGGYQDAGVGQDEGRQWRLHGSLQSDVVQAQLGRGRQEYLDIPRFDDMNTVYMTNGNSQMWLLPT